MRHERRQEPCQVINEPRSESTDIIAADWEWEWGAWRWLDNGPYGELANWPTSESHPEWCACLYCFYFYIERH